MSIHSSMLHMASLNKQLALLQPLLSRQQSQADLIQTLLKNKEISDFKNMSNTLRDIGYMKSQAYIMTFTKHLDHPRYLSKLKKICEQELDDVTVDYEQTGEDYTFKVGEEQIRVSGNKSHYEFEEDEEDNLIIPQPLKQLFKKVGSHLTTGAFYCGHPSEKIMSIGEEHTFVVVFIRHADRRLLKEIKWLGWKPISGNEQPDEKNKVGSIRFRLDADRAHFAWKESFAIGTYIACLLPLGIIVNELLGVLGFSHKDVPLRTTLIILAFSAIIGIIDFYQRNRSLTITNGTINSRCGVIPISGLLWKSVHFKNVLKMSMKSRLESSGNEDGPSTYATYHDLYIVTKDAKQIRIVKGVKKLEANFLLKQLTKYKVLYTSSNKS